MTINKSDHEKANEHFGNAIGEMAKGRAYLDDVELEDEIDSIFDRLLNDMRRIQNEASEEDNE